MKPERVAILDSVRAAREGREVRRNLPFAEHMCRIPVVDMPALNALFPGLDGKSGTEAHDFAMQAFHASPASEPYRVNRTVRGGSKPRGIIIRVPEPKKSE